MRTKIGRRMALGLSLAALLPLGPVAAQSGSEQQARLEQAAAGIDSKLGGKVGAMQHVELRRQREEIDEAIKQLQAGRHVSTEEIDRILGEVTFERVK